MSFSPEERGFLAQLADVLIPAGDGMPSASQAKVHGQWLDQVLAARPDLARGLRHALSRLNASDPIAAIATLKQNDAAAFGALTEFAAAAYFMNPKVLQAIGYSGQDRRPIDPHADYLDDGLLQSVIDRGPIYRPTPHDTV